MSYTDDLLKLEAELYSCLYNGRLDEFEEALDKRDGICRILAMENPEEFKKFMDSEAFKESCEKIKRLFADKKEAILDEMKKLASSKKAAGEYAENAGMSYNLVSKKV